MQTIDIKHQQINVEKYLSFHNEIEKLFIINENESIARYGSTFIYIKNNEYYKMFAPVTLAMMWAWREYIQGPRHPGLLLLRMNIHNTPDHRIVKAPQLDALLNMILPTPQQEKLEYGKRIMGNSWNISRINEIFKLCEESFQIRVYNSDIQIPDALDLSLPFYAIARRHDQWLGYNELLRD